MANTAKMTASLTVTPLHGSAKTLSGSFTETTGDDFGNYFQDVTPTPALLELPDNITEYSTFAVLNHGANPVFIGDTAVKAEMLLKVCADGGCAPVHLNPDITEVYLVSEGGNSKVEILVPEKAPAV